MWSVSEVTPSFFKHPFRMLAEISVFCAALVMLAASLAAGAGLLPWVELSLSIAGKVVLKSGEWLQVSATAFLIVLTLFQQKTSDEYSQDMAEIRDPQAQPQTGHPPKPLPETNTFPDHPGFLEPAWRSALQNSQEIDDAIATLASDACNLA